MVHFSVRSMLQAIRKAWCKMVLNSCVMAPITPVVDFINDRGAIIAQYAGTSIDIPDTVKVTKTGQYTFKMWVRSSCGVRFTYVPRNTSIDVCLVGHGGVGGDPTSSHNNETGVVVNTGGKGGSGGQVYTHSSAIDIWPSFWIDCVIQDTTYIRYGTESFGAATGTGKLGGDGGTTTITPESVDDSDPDNPVVTPETIVVVPPAMGANGLPAFGDENFDGILYAPGGGGASGLPYSWHAPTALSTDAPGAGGHGRTTMSDEIDVGRKGIILIRTHVSA